MRLTGVSTFLAALATAWLLCGAAAQTKPANGTTAPAANNASAPAVASGPLPAHHGGGQGSNTAAQPIDFTTGPATTAAFIHLSFGINVWNPQMTVPMFNKPGIKALFAQSIKNAVPDAVVVSEALAATKGILVRSTVRFQADAAGAKAQADALVKYLTEASLLKQMLPEVNWHPVLVYTTFPYLASAVVYPVGPAADRTPSLHFTLRVPGVNKATFDAKKLAAWKAALVAALPGLTDQGIAALTTESTELTSHYWYTRTDTLVHTQVTGPTLQALRLFSPKLRYKPNTIWSRYTFGAVDAVPRSWVIVAYAPPTALDGATLYLTFRGKGNPLPLTAQKKQQLAQTLLAALNLDPSLGYTAQNIELAVVRTTRATSRRLHGIGDVITVIQAKLKVVGAATKEILQDAAGGIATFFRAISKPITSWWKDDEVCIAKDKQGTCDPTFAPILPPVFISDCHVNTCILLDSSGSTEGEPWDAEKSVAASIVQTIGMMSQFEVRRFSGKGDVEVIVPTTSRTALEADASITIVRKILSADNPTTGTDIAGAIQACKVSLLKSNPPAVPSLKNVIILLTDGQEGGGDTSTDKLHAAAQEAKNAGMSIVTVRAGNFKDEPNPEEILAQARKDMRLVSGPGSGFYFEASAFDQATLQLLADSASKAACGAQGSTADECTKLTGQTYCIYCGTKRQTCIAEGKPCKAYYLDSGERKEAVLQLCSSPAFAPRGNPTSATGKCPAYITAGAKMDFTVSKYPDEQITECDCAGLPTDTDFVLSTKPPASMATCINKLKAAHPNWTFQFYQTKDSSKMNLAKFAAAQYAYGDKSLYPSTYKQSGKVSDHCDMQEPNESIAKRIWNGCELAATPPAVCQTNADKYVSWPAGDWRRPCSVVRVKEAKMSYFIDATNFLDDGTLGIPCHAAESFAASSIYQFLDFTQYDGAGLSESLVNDFLVSALSAAKKPTDKIGPSTVAAHAKWFYESAQAVKLLPQFLIAKSATETGYWANNVLTTTGVACDPAVHAWGNSANPTRCTAGTRAFNYFMMGAFDAIQHSTVVNNAAIEGFKRGWLSQEQGVRGGVARFSQVYVKDEARAAFNLHVLDWNLRYWSRNGAIGPQYATNVGSAQLKGKVLGRILKATGTAVTSKLTFRIPVFQEQGFVKCNTPPPVCPTIPGFTLKKNVYSIYADINPKNPYTGKTPAQLAALCGSGCKAFTTSGYLKSQVWPEKSWDTWADSGPCGGMYVKNGITYDDPDCDPSISKNKEFCAYCGEVNGGTSRQTCVGASGVKCKYDSAITLQLCSALPHSSEGSGKGSCPKTISPGGNAFTFKKLATDLASLPSCGKGAHIFLAPTTQVENSYCPGHAFTNEGRSMQDIAKNHLAPALKKLGFEVTIVSDSVYSLWPGRDDCYGKGGYEECLTGCGDCSASNSRIKTKIREALALKPRPDLYLSLHSDAVDLSRCNKSPARNIGYFAHSKDALTVQKLALAICEAIRTDTKYGGGCKDLHNSPIKDSWIEPRNVRGQPLEQPSGDPGIPMILMEIGWHDLDVDLDWMDGNRAKIGAAIAKAISSYYNKET